MIRVYYLPVITMGGVEQVAGIEFIHDALLDCTDQSDVRILIQDTIQAEHDGLIAVALSWRLPTQEESDRYNAEVTPFVPDPAIARIKAILHTSPPPIPAPQQWELFKLLAHLHGIDV